MSEQIQSLATVNPLDILSDITTHMKYAKYDPTLQRRETYEEICDRNSTMHIAKYPQLKDEILSIYENFVKTKKVLPSMRSMQFSGLPIERSPVRIYNCSFLPVDNILAFSETIFLLLSGVGVGYSVQNHHIEKLPEIRKPNPKKTKRFLIGDSIEGWSDSVKVLIKSYFNSGPTVNFDYGDIRPKGARLITAGGKAPGPEPLRICHVKISSILNQKEDGEQLTSLEVHDIMCYLADAVLAGGIRRAAMISLFDADDMDMITCKSGNWWELNPQRGRANNSAVLLRNKITKDFFIDLWKRIENSRAGEPGIFFTNDKDWGTNPCVTGDTMVATADGRNAVSIKELADTSNGVIKFPVYSGKASTYGNQFGSTDKFNKWKPEIQNAVAFKSGTKPTVEVLLSNGDRFRCTDNHRLALPNGEYVEAKDSVGLELESFFTYNDNSSGKKYRHINSFTNGYAKQHRMIYEFHNGSLPSGYVIDHIENNFNDNISNLQLLTKEEHDVKSGSERLGLNNGIHKIKDNPNYRHNLSLNATLNSNGNSNGLSNIELIEIGKQVVSNGDKLTINNCIKINSKFPKTFSKNRFNESFGYFKDVVNGVVEYVEPTLPEYSNWKNNKKIDLTSKENLRVIEVEYTGEIEDVYDLTVDNNSNFYILTSGDDGFVNSRGVLVHNCCFTGDTLITVKDVTSDGIDGLEYKIPIIELVKMKDTNTLLPMALSFDTDNKAMEWKQITNAFLSKKSATLIKLNIDVNGESIPITCTPDHRFYTTNRGYVEAKDLTITDDLVVGI